jgi:predicted Zn-dependent protease
MQGIVMNARFIRVAQVVVLATVVTTLVGCTTVPVTGRQGINLVSAGEETQLGVTAFEQMKKETPISKDPALNALVQKVGKQIARVADKDMPNAQWEFVVFDSKEANAFCLPGGKVGIYTGILPITKTEAGLATVMGHEVAHAVAHHGAERMSHAMLMQTGQQALGVALSSSDPRWQSAALMAYGLGSQVGVALPFDRKQESEADHIGLIYMAARGMTLRRQWLFGNGSTPTIRSVAVGTTRPRSCARTRWTKFELNSFRSCCRPRKRSSPAVRCSSQLPCLAPVWRPKVRAVARGEKLAATGPLN